MAREVKEDRGENAELDLSELQSLIKAILTEVDSREKEISYHCLESLIRQRGYGRTTLRNIEYVLAQGTWVLETGWGRGKKGLYRIPFDLRVAVTRSANAWIFRKGGVFDEP
jgi:hypothetical protein